MTKYEKLLQRAERRAFERAVIEKCYSPILAGGLGLRAVNRCANILWSYNPELERMKNGHLPRPLTPWERFLLKYAASVSENRMP